MILWLLLAAGLALAGYTVWAVRHPHRCGAPGRGAMRCVRTRHRGDHRDVAGVGWSGVWRG